MPIYIVRSKSAITGRSVALMERKFSLEDRINQIREVFSLRLEDPVDGTIRSWAHEGEQKGSLRRLTLNVEDTQITGTTLVEMSEEEEQQLRQDVPDALVLRDGPIELIQPRRVTDTKSSAPSDEDIWHLAAIGLEGARKDGFNGTGTGQTVAVLDTGVDESHAELTGKIDSAYTFDVSTWNAKRMSPSQDTDGHGTHVAGLVCGDRVGVAPGAKVVSGVMIPGGFGNLSDFILALEWAASNPAVQIINMSAGIRGFEDGMQSIVEDILAVGILPIFATGNEGRNRTRSPGNYAEPLSIGASNRDGKVAGFSSSGTMIAENHQYQIPDLVAPGVQVYSSVMGGGYEAWDGTSMATPVVAGVAALILEQEPDITVMDLMDALVSTCRDLGYPRERQGAGLVQVHSVL